MKLLQENTGGKIHDIRLGMISQLWHQKHRQKKKQKPKLKIDQWEWQQVKQLLHKKESINRVKRQPAEREKIFAKHIYDQGFISKICLPFLVLISQNAAAGLSELMELRWPQHRPSDVSGTRQGSQGGGHGGQGSRTGQRKVSRKMTSSGWVPPWRASGWSHVRNFVRSKLCLSIWGKGGGESLWLHLSVTG